MWTRLGGKAKPLKAPKRAPKELDEDDLAHLEKKRAGTFYPPRLPEADNPPQDPLSPRAHTTTDMASAPFLEEKARKEMAAGVGKGKGPLNTGSQGIKKSGKK